ncbi:hypothetical protein [Petrimonas mucosa]|uniref:hypothetical protein n=1 Tax=Petrimonas mucosa TaxID=1642646 RepID=UPI0023F49C16|nr:hypothetical protein [Petrimonas mucosa]
MLKSIFLIFMLVPLLLQAQEQRNYWNQNLAIIPYRLPPPPIGYQVEYIDFDGDGKPDAIKSVTINDTPILWIDDDNNMQYGDLEGDIVNDCLLIDRNKDGVYGGPGDLIIKWCDTDGDGIADLQLLVEYPETDQEEVWPHGHYMWVMDTDGDQVFNYIDWNTMQLKAWEFSGTSDFITDYSGKSLFIKVHAATNRMDDLRFNWENPFLFYDPDDDGLSEIAIRLVDSPRYFNDSTKVENPKTMYFNGKIDWVSISVDLDNDNGTGNEFDFDFTLNFRGEGFDYTDKVQPLPNFKGLAAADSFFMDPRWRHLEELIYPDHDQALDLIFSDEAKWNSVYFVYDEDDDCHRWERVELLDPLDPFKIGTGKGGIDNNPQADSSGDRGEWDMDNSGGGKLYIGKFDGRLHLYGAEWGCWRIDQQARYYQGYNRTWKPGEPKVFATVKYSDTNNNGFIDLIEYDMDGDQKFEERVSLLEMGIDDRCELYDPVTFEYKDYQQLKKAMAENLWEQAHKAVRVAEQFGVNTSWYAKLKQATSVREKYHNGYWLQYYIYKDLQDLCLRTNNRELLKQITVAYFTSDWQSILK